MKQTATDYLYECFIDLFRQYTEGEMDGGKFGELITEAHQQAKEMEKQQITDAYIYARISRGSDTYLDDEANKYYYQTFNQ